MLSLAVVGAGAALLLRRRPWLAFACGGLATGAAVGALFWWSLAGQSAAIDGARGPYTVTAVDDARSGTFGDRSTVRMIEPVRGRLEVMWPPGTAPQAGQTVTFAAEISTGGNDEWARRRHRDGVAAQARARGTNATAWERSIFGVVGRWRARVLFALATIRGSGADLVAGVVLGDRRRLAGTSAEKDFRTTGLSHLVAVSGSHLVVVAVLVTWGLSRLGVRRVPRFASAACLVGLYVVATGVQASAIRAWGMSLVAAASTLSGRRSDALAGLCIAAGVNLAVDPTVAFDIGFQLSVAAVAGLVVFARLTESWVMAATPRPMAALVGPIALTLTAQAATLPLTTATFGTVSLISPLANLFAGPLVTGVLVVGLAGVVVATGWQAAGVILLRTASLMGTLTVAVASRLARVPFASVGLDSGSVPVWSIVTIGAVAMVWARWPRPDRAIARVMSAGVALALVVFVAGPPPPTGSSITVMDVGQGDAILIQDGGSTLLVDTGPDGAALSEALRRAGIRRIETLLITHFHDDHFGGAEGLGGSIRVGTLLVPAGGATQIPREVASIGTAAHEAVAGQTIRCGRIVCTVLSPTKPVTDASANESSVVLLVEAGAIRALLTGDAESVVTDPVVASGSIGDIDVLKVGHHGSGDSVSAQALSVMRPERALISVGEGNRYGHPHAATLAALEACGARVERTDIDGDLRVELGEWDTERAAASPVSQHTIYGTLVEQQVQRTYPQSRGAHERERIRPPARVSHSERAGLLAAAGRGPPEDAGRRIRGPRFQSRDLRRRERCR